MPAIIHGIWGNRPEALRALRNWAWLRARNPLYQYPAILYSALGQNLPYSPPNTKIIPIIANENSWIVKFQIIRQAIIDRGAVIWMDLDVKPLLPWTDDIWKQLAEGEPIRFEQSARRTYKLPWRRIVNQYVPWGAFIYCRELQIIDEIINILQRCPWNGLKSDEWAIAWWYDHNIRHPNKVPLDTWTEEYARRFMPPCTIAPSHVPRSYRSGKPTFEVIVNQHHPDLGKRKMMTPDIQHIEIDITYACNLRCNDCNRGISVARFGHKYTLSPEFIAYHLQAAEQANHHWRHICVIGGEPTLHPEFKEVMEVLMRHRDKHGTILEVATNGQHEIAINHAKWAKHRGIRIRNTNKTGSIQPHHVGFLQAPQDYYPHWVESHRFMGCIIPTKCGIGLTRDGYYVCNAGATIDRIFGLKLAIPEIKDVATSALMSTYNRLCRHCGHYSCQQSKPEPSISWRIALEQYNSVSKPGCRTASTGDTAPDLDMIYGQNSLTQISIPSIQPSSKSPQSAKTEDTIPTSPTPAQPPTTESSTSQTS